MSEPAVSSGELVTAGRSPVSGGGAVGRLNPWVLGGIITAEVSLAIWGGASVIVFALALHTWVAICWIPAVALGGVMLASTMFSLLPGMDRAIRMYAGVLALVAIVGEMVVAGAMHYFEAKAPPGAPAATIHVGPQWGFVIGGLPSLTGGALIHLTAMYFAQKRREGLERDQEIANLDTARGIRAANDAEDIESAQRRAMVRQADEQDATRSRQVMQQQLHQARALQAERDTVLAEIEKTNQALDEARREQERLRSRARRQRDRQATPATASQPVSQPVAADPATVSQPGSPDQAPPASRQQRRDWAREQINSGAWERDSGRELTGADIDRKFGPPRTGAAILRELATERDAELRAITDPSPAAHDQAAESPEEGSQ